MDPNPKSFPILSYVLTRFPSFGTKPSSPSTNVDIEQPSALPQQPPPPSESFLSSMPHLSNPKVIASMRRAVAEVSQTRSVLRALGPRPDHETVDIARIKLAEIEASLTPQLEEMSLTEDEVRASERQRSAEKEKKVYKAVLDLDEMHDAYEKMLKEFEEKLVKIYENVETGGDKGEDEEVACEEPNEEIVKVLMEANEEDLERIELSNRGLRLLPEAFGKIFGLRVLDLSNNQLQAIPDSISGLQHLQELNIASNLLERLPDSIGVLQNLKILDASSNKLEALPDSISYCRSLLELDVSFNRLTYLPTNIGYELVILQKLNIKLNKIRSLPSSIGEMRSLRYLDAHFNQLQGLPLSIGKLTNVEILDLSSNFSDLTELPNTFGDLINLKELNLSNNQIHALPDTFGRLENLTKLNLDQNPLVIPPVEVVNEGVEAVKRFMSKRWLDILEDEERKSQLEEQEQAQTGWLTRSTSMLKSYVTGISESVSEYLSPRSPIDAYLNQQL